jgi:hypothetical protein
MRVLFAIGQERQRRARVQQAMQAAQGNPNARMETTYDEQGYPVPKITTGQPGGGSVNVYGFNPATNTLTSGGTVPKNAKVYTAGQGGATPQADIEQITQDIQSGSTPPDLSQVSSYRDRSRVTAQIGRSGLDLSKLQTDWKAMQTAVKSANSSQQLRMRQALSSVQGGVSSLRQLNDEFKRTGWTPANGAMLKLALTGTDPTKRDIATRYITQINAMRDELAQGFMGGGVPSETAFKLTNEILNPVYGSRQFSAAIDQLETNLGIRLNAVNSLQPLTAGEMSPQYQRMNQPTGVTPGLSQPTGTFAMKNAAGDIFYLPVNQVKSAMTDPTEPLELVAQ